MATGIIGHKFVGFLSIWNAVKEKVYKGKMGKPFKSEKELKQKIKAVNVPQTKKRSVRLSGNSFHV